MLEERKASRKEMCMMRLRARTLRDEDERDVDSATAWRFASFEWLRESA